ncbi:MAG: AI-2E family transporter, partial [Candidatus Marinimicrobia bacterium]|nr:AI-2E family transporter [Candidatus Neomarinimicrobiota bacterium]
MIEKQKNYFQLIYRIIIALITVGFLTIVWPFISGVLLMLVFAFLLTTVLLSFVDSLERKIKSRGLSVLAVTVAVLGAIGLFIGSFIAQLSAQAKDFASRVDHDTLTAEFKALAEKFTSAMPSFMRE